jgi:hypothetical protein
VPPALAAEAISEASGAAHDHPAEAPLGRLPLAAPMPDAEGDTLEAMLGTGQQSIARWRAPACLRILNASSTLAQQIEAEVRGVAVAAAIPYHWGRCRPNLTLTLTSAASPTRRYARRKLPGPPALATAALVLDKRRAEALPPSALGAYVALTGFAELPANAAPARGSLLALFDGDNAPRALTTVDLDFLRRLYAR